MTRRLVLCCWLAMSVFGLPLRADDALREQATKALRKATEFFRTQVAVEGSYRWRYSEDLKLREGERKATATQAWVQPPGTPSVGMAFLRAYEATGDKYYLEAAKESAYALAKGQLRSGGWDYHIEFDPTLRRQYAYRVGGTETGRNVTTLDDNNTQSALRFLIRVDRALGFDDAQVFGPVGYALECLLKAQYPNGSWPQRYSAFPDPTKHPVKKASYPERWSRTFPKENYGDFYTLNDNTLADVVDTLLEAYQNYGDPRFRAAALNAGAFLLLAQMPEPQPAGAQQYDLNMHPAWARRFEPPAVTGGESFGAMQTLLTLYRETGDKKYLEPIPKALAYFQRSRLPDGRLARFYELKTNKPLYFTKDYQLTYSDSDLPTHYGFKVQDRTERVEKDYQRLLATDPKKRKAPEKSTRPRPADGLEARVKTVLAALDERGRWVEAGRLRTHGDDATKRIISAQTFITNLGVLSDYLAATRK